MADIERRRSRPLDWPGLPALFGRRLFEWPELPAGWFGAIPEPIPSPLGHVSIEEYREDGDVVVRAELPGLDPEQDLEVTVEDGVLRIRAERRMEEKTETKEGYRSEFRYGSFVRQVALPIGADDEHISAAYDDGILTVRVPVDVEQEKADVRRIPVARS